MNAEHHVELARRMIAVHNRGPEAFLAEFEEFFLPDCEWIPVIVGSLEGNSYRGRDGFRRWYAERDDALEASGVDVTSCTAVSEDVVLVLGRSRARGRASGAELDEEVGLVLRFRDGRIEHDQAFASHREARMAAEALHA
jgi:ketosteroid isomerase-like protein